MIDFDALKGYIYENFNVPADNCTMAPEMLENIFEYASELPSSEQVTFLKRMLTSLEPEELEKFVY